MKIELEVSDEVEATASPWWVIIDPSQNFRTDARGVSNVAHMITGPFFSRAAAQKVLDTRRHRFGPYAVVWCHSGHMTVQYDQVVREAQRQSRESEGATAEQQGGPNCKACLKTKGSSVPMMSCADCIDAFKEGGD